MKIIKVFFTASVIYLLFSGITISQNFRDQVMLDSAGNVYLAGQTKCTNDSDIVIIRYSAADGSITWQRQSGLQGSTFFRSAVLKGGYIYVSALNDYAGNKRLVILRSDLSGNFVSTIFSRPGGNYGNAITVDNSNNVFVAGRVDYPIGNPKFLVVKYNSNLDSIWSFVYTGSTGGFDEALAVKTDQQSNVFVTGYTSQSVTMYDTYDYLTLRVNSNGTLNWAKKFNGSAGRQDEAVALVLDASSKVYVTGFSYQTGGSNIFTIKYNDSNGDSITSVSQTCGTNTLNQPVAMTIDNLDNIYITGFGQCNVNNLYNFVTVKYNSSLVPQWSSPSIVLGTGNNTPMGISFSNSNVYVTGESDSSSGRRKFLTLKYYAATGAEQWRWYLGASDSNFGSSVTSDANDNVYVTGYSGTDTITSAKYNGWVSRYGFCPPFGIRILSTLTPKEFSLFQNYPNPFNPSTLIKFDVSKKSNIKIVIFDAIGRRVDEIVNKELRPGTYEAQWDGSSFVSGVYFIQLIADTYSETRKMVLLK